MEKILRMKIYNTTYWKEHCFGLTAASVVEKAGTTSASSKSCHTIALRMSAQSMSNSPDHDCQLVLLRLASVLHCCHSLTLTLDSRAHTGHLIPLTRHCMTTLQGHAAHHSREV